jgi:hypothetical protein
MIFLPRHAALLSCASCVCCVCGVCTIDFTLFMIKCKNHEPGKEFRDGEFPMHVSFHTIDMLRRLWDWRL